MVTYKDTSRFRRSWPWWRWVLTTLILLGFALSVYLSWHHLTGDSMIGCGSGSPCDQVLSSRWSTIGGILPVSGLAAGIYMAMLAASIFIGPATDASVRRLAWGAMLVLVGAAAGSAAWFIVLQKWIIGAFCPYCTTAHITGLLLAALVIWQASKQFDNDSKDVSLTNVNVVGLSILGLVMACILAVFQVIFTPPPAYLGGESQENLPVIQSHDVPLIGSPDAEYVVTLLFDYKCPHCQKMHFMLNEVTRRYGGKLAFALCPAPLDSQCNPYVSQDADEFKDSCELVKVGLAVWLANRDAFPAFENWMFSFESGDRWQPRLLDAARAKAVELVGQAKFDAASADPWIDRYIQTSIRIYGNTIQTGKSAIPKLVFGSRWVIPEPYDADDLIMILQESLGVPSPEPAMDFRGP